jgi:hypothetical protein
MEEEFKIQPSLWIEENINANVWKEKRKEILKTFILKKIGNIIVEIHYICWSFYSMNDNKLVDVKCFQLFVMLVQFQ